VPVACSLGRKAHSALTVAVVDSDGVMEAIGADCATAIAVVTFKRRASVRIRNIPRVGLVGGAESRGELAASRVRIVNAADTTRRGIERDLHDGVQQHLVALTLALQTAQAAVPPELRELDGALSHVGDGLADVQAELLEIARGIHPAILARGGLGPALKLLARRSPIVVELDVHADRRLPEPVEVATYYVVSEALTNAVKYANASVVHVTVEVTEHELRASVADDGVGGADATRGSGLVGLKDRVEALGGTITVDSHVGAGTALRVELPLADTDALREPKAR
jgi:signal transduction histidine kinase